MHGKAECIATAAAHIQNGSSKMKVRKAPLGKGGMTLVHVIKDGSAQLADWLSGVLNVGEVDRLRCVRLRDGCIFRTFFLFCICIHDCLNSFW